MASADSLEKEITCPVCFDIYREPHVLRECLHTFCLQCLQKLTHGGSTAVCPQCRVVSSDIKKDFKMQRLLDLYQQSQQVADGGKNCGLCEEGQRPLVWYCEECSHFICSVCHKIHFKTAALKSHKLTSIVDMISDYDNRLETVVTALKQDLQDSNALLVHITNRCEVVKQSNVSQMSTMRELTQKIIHVAKETEQRLEKVINDANSDLQRNLSEAKMSLNDHKKELLSKMTLLEDMRKTRDIHTLKETVNSVAEAIVSDLHRQKEAIQKLEVRCKSVKVHKNAEWCNLDN